jgi:hypothetical protein
MGFNSAFKGLNPQYRRRILPKSVEKYGKWGKHCFRHLEKLRLSAIETIFTELMLKREGYVKKYIENFVKI